MQLCPMVSSALVRSCRSAQVAAFAEFSCSVRTKASTPEPARTRLLHTQQGTVLEWLAAKSEASMYEIAYAAVMLQSKTGST